MDIAYLALSHYTTSMANPNKQKGTRAETQVVEYLRAHGYPLAERRALHGALDQGDVIGIPDVALEVKDCRTMTLAAWVDEARIEAANAKVPIGVVVHKRRGHGTPGEWYASMTFDTLLMLLDRVSSASASGSCAAPIR